MGHLIMTRERKVEKKKRIILTGPTGAIGMAVIQECIRRNWEVCAVVNPGSERKERIKRGENITVVECDLSEIETLCKLENGKKADYFLHLAWSGTFGADRQDEMRQNQNVVFARKACETAKKLGCKVFLFAGSQAEFGRVEGKLQDKIPVHPENAYGSAKLRAGRETLKLCKQLDMRHIYFRILSVYGPGDGENTMIMSTIQKLLKGESPRFTPAEQMWDYLYSEDAAVALLDSCMKGVSDKVYCLGSGQAKPLKEYIEIIGEIVAPEVKLGIGEYPYNEKQVMYLCADITDLEKDFGFLPKTGFEEGIRRTAAYVKEHMT